MRRNNTIDFMKALAIILMFFLHSSSYYLNDKTLYFLWDVGHFAVPLFVFCSAYIYFLKNESRGITALIPYLKKRLPRLIRPYYIFLGAIFAFYLAFRPEIMTLSFIKNSLLLVQTAGGTEISWLVILFIYLTVLFPVILWMKKRPLFLQAYAGLSFLSAALLLLGKPPVDYRIYMWLPWSAIVILAYWASKRNGTSMSAVTISAAAVTALSYLVLTEMGRSTQLFANKYPPNIFYLSYGAAWICLLFAAGHRIAAAAEGWVLFLSGNSYSLFFIHWLWLMAMTRFSLHHKVEFIVFFAAVILSSLGSVFIIGKMANLISLGAKTTGTGQK